MTDSFTEAALVRVARCAGFDLYASPSGEVRLAPRPHHTYPRNQLSGAAAATTRADANVLELLEMAVASGYVDLTSWRGAESLRSIALSILESDESSLRTHQVASIRRLLNALNDPKPTGAPKTSAAFSAFESYLSMTHWISEDGDVIEALQSTHTTWQPEDDLGALLTPRHLAECIATGTVGSVRMRGVRGLPRALEAFEWLWSIASHLPGNGDVRDSMLSCAEWSHACWLFRMRVDEWALAMSEWSTGRDREGESRWSAFRFQIFGWLEFHQRRLALDISTNGRITQQEEIAPLAYVPRLSSDVTSEEIDRRCDNLLSEGRDEAARRLLGAFMMRLAVQIDRPVDADIVEDIRQLVEMAVRLAGIGDIDSACALLAPRLRLIQAVGGETTERANELIAKSRRGVDSARESSQTLSAPQDVVSLEMTSEVHVEQDSMNKESEES